MVVETWGYIKAEEIEVVHRKFIKFALGLPSTAANLASYGEIGRTSLDIRCNVLMVKYWLRHHKRRAGGSSGSTAGYSYLFQQLPATCAPPRSKSTQRMRHSHAHT